MTTQIFVFGSNLSGIHGAGAARFAMKNHQAVWGVGYGRQGTSFAIPTKDERIKTLSFARVQFYVQAFINHAASNLDDEFQVTRIGCGLAGFTDAQIAPLFITAPTNCHFDEEWKSFFKERNFKYWGTL